MNDEHMYNNGERTAKGRKRVDNNYKKTQSIAHQCSLSNAEFINEELLKYNIYENKYCLTAFATLSLMGLSTVLKLLSIDINNYNNSIKKMGLINASKLKTEIKRLWKEYMGEEF